MVYEGRGIHFSRIIWRVDSLTRGMVQGYKLSDRDRRFLDLVVKRYPPKPTDSCMSFHVEQCLKTNALLNP